MDVSLSLANLVDYLIAESENSTYSNAARNAYLFTTSLLYFLLVFGFFFSNTNDYWMSAYTFLVYFPPIVLYWTPLVKKKLFSSLKNKYRFILFPFLLIPIIGTFFLLIPIVITIHEKNKAKVKQNRKSAELKRNIVDFDFPEDLEDEGKQLLERAKNISSVQDREEVRSDFEKLKDQRDQKISEHIDKFVNKYGKGTPKQIEHLTEIIRREEGHNIDYKVVKEKVHSKIVAKQEDKFWERIEEHEPQNYEETLEAFIEEFGNGNERTRNFLRQNTSQSNVKEDIENKIQEIQRQKELEEFKKDFNEEPDSVDILDTLKEEEIDWKEIQEMEGLDFEELIADLFEEKDYSARVTSGSGDQGADIIADKDFEKIAIQAKRYSGKVSNSAVQEVVSSMNYYDATRGIVITNSQFTTSARELAESNDIQLWGGEKLHEEIDTYLNKNF